MIVIGASVGGLQAIQLLLAQLPASVTLPIAIVMHRHRDSASGLVEILQRDSVLTATEVVDKERIEGGRVYLAPADYHLLIDGDHFALSVDDPVLYARPSIDVLFESAAAERGRDAIGIVLTGGSADGARGAAAIENSGGTVIVQAPEEATCSDMPLSAIAATRHPEIFAIEAIARRIVELASK